MIPLWVLLSLLAAVSSAAMFLLQEKFKIESLALSMWCKVACILATLPFVLMTGFPDDPRFYGWLVVQSLMFAINDIIMFRAIPIVGAAVVSRLMPVTIILSFLLWFAVDPALIGAYAAQPVISTSIVGILLCTIYLAMRLSRCEVTMGAVRKLWFVIIANTLGWVFAKIVIGYAPVHQGAVAFTFVEAWMMIGFWIIYLVAARPVTARSLFAPAAIKGGLAVGIAMAGMVLSTVAAFHYIDNPGYVSAIRILDVVIIALVHKAIGKDDDSDRAAGFGIVACAVILVLLKSQI